MHTPLQNQLGALRVESSGVPIYVQIRDQFLAGVGGGLITPGSQMPTMRQVAVALRVDLNTVRRAYGELERMGVVKLVRGRGSFVAEPPPNTTPDLASRTDELARRTLVNAAAMGIDAAVLAERILSLSHRRERDDER